MNLPHHTFFYSTSCISNGLYYRSIFIEKFFFCYKHINLANGLDHRESGQSDLIFLRLKLAGSYQEVVFDINDSYLSRMSAEVNRYHDHRWNAWRASLKHTSFNNPSAIISFIAAVILLLLTLAQTIYGVYGFYQPHS